MLNITKKLPFLFLLHNDHQAVTAKFCTRRRAMLGSDLVRLSGGSGPMSSHVSGAKGGFVIMGLEAKTTTQQAYDINISYTYYIIHHLHIYIYIFIYHIDINVHKYIRANSIMLLSFPKVAQLYFHLMPWCPAPPCSHGPFASCKCC